MSLVDTNQYELMYLIRTFEEIICPYIDDETIKTPCHLYIGQEAIAVGICSNLLDDDLIWGNHRSHGHFIAKGGNIDSLMREIFCKESGCSGGRGGSMHIMDKKKGVLGTVPIVAGTVPLSVGAALSLKMEKQKNISVSFLGDGATEEGHVIESMNIAALYNLPVLFIIENNLYSSHMHMDERRKQPDLQKIGQMLGISTVQIDGNNLREVEQVARKRIEDMRSNNEPQIIECLTYRWRGHVGTSWDIDVGVKRKDELDVWKLKDPLIRERNKLLEEGASKSTLNKIEEKINEKLDKTLKSALKAPFPKADSLMNHVFVTD